jgi:uncharacterized protein YbjT (DUF2867 family)
MVVIMSNSEPSLILVSGATGYIGGRLVPRLLDQGYQVRVMVRDPSRLQGRSWLKQVEVVQADVFQPETLCAAMQGVRTAYYLIHTMSDHADFAKRDLVASSNFGDAAYTCGVKHIIYLGGLGDTEADLSGHLRSRIKTGEILRKSGVAITEFRASIIVGSGSISFEIIRYLTERLPLIVAPRAILTKVQPIAVRNALNYLIAALENPNCHGQVIEIGGADILTYRAMMLEYARIRDLRRYIVIAPFHFSPRLASYMLHLLTPVHANVAHPLLEGLRNEVIVKTHTAEKLFPAIKPMPYTEAVQRALTRLEYDEVETTWSDSLSSSLGDDKPVILTSYEGMLLEHRQAIVEAPQSFVFAAFSCIGGQRGWPTYNHLWRLRGGMDSMMGGVGFRRGRRHPSELRVGDALDFWRVETIEPNSLLRLRAEMKVPGLAWLQFKAEKIDERRTRLLQTALFDPKGLPGFLYWYLLYPIHGFIFSSMIDKLCQIAEKEAVAAFGLNPAKL